MKRMNPDDAMYERTSDLDALASWVRYSATAERQATHGGASSFTSTVDGVLTGVDPENLWLRGHAALTDEDAPEVAVYHHLPATIDLTSLIGKAIRVTMICEPGTCSSEACDCAGVAPRTGLDRTLLISGDGGRMWLIARSGTVHGMTHALSSGCGDVSLHAALSQRPQGPLVVGTTELQCLVSVGQSALVRMPDGARFRVLLVKRATDGTASYVISDESLFVEAAS